MILSKQLLYYFTDILSNTLNYLKMKTLISIALVVLVSLSAVAQNTNNQNPGIGFLDISIGQGLSNYDGRSYFGNKYSINIVLGRFYERLAFSFESSEPARIVGNSEIKTTAFGLHYSPIVRAHNKHWMSEFTLGIQAKSIKRIIKDQSCTYGNDGTTIVGFSIDCKQITDKSSSLGIGIPVAYVIHYDFSKNIGCYLKFLCSIHTDESNYIGAALGLKIGKIR